MYKFFSLIPVVFLSSCLFSNNIIVDETDDKAVQKQSEIQNTGDVDGDTEIIDERKVITRDDTNFSIDDLNTGINDENFLYQFSGVAKDSSDDTKVAVAKLKQERNDIVFVLYFDFDSNELSEFNRQMIALHQEFMQKNPNVSLTLDGHTDIKGSREYNLSLGEKRALSVKNAMQTTADIQTVSFGEEKIVSIVDSENRRVEFIYK